MECFKVATEINGCNCQIYSIWAAEIYKVRILRYNSGAVTIMRNVSVVIYCEIKSCICDML